MSKARPRGSVIYEPKGRAREYAPLACNLFRGRCAYRCKYCFVPKMPWATDDDRNGPMRPREDILARLAHDAERMAGDPRPILLSFTSDLLILREHDLHWTVLTKGGTRAAHDFDLYREGDTYAASIVFSRHEREWEPHTACVAVRWVSLMRARDRGIRTWVSVEPVIYPDQALEVIRHAVGRADAVKIGKLNYHPHSKSIRWDKFGADLAETLEEVELPYLVKDSLAEYMPEGFVLDTMTGEGGNDDDGHNRDEVAACEHSRH